MSTDLSRLEEIYGSKKTPFQLKRQSVKNGLTPQQIQQFKDDGFLIIRNLLPREAVQPLIDELAQRVDEATNEASKAGGARSREHI